MQSAVRRESEQYAVAYAYVQSLQRSGELDESYLASFAQDGKFDETTIALSLMCDLSIDLVERVLTQYWSDQLLVLAKSVGLSWSTTKAMLLLAETKGISKHELDQCLADFTRLRSETSKKAVHFYRLREQVATT